MQNKWALHQPKLRTIMLHNAFNRNDSKLNKPVSSTTQNIVVIVYILQLISLFSVGLFSFIPLIINYFFRYQARNTWLDSHFRWQIQTFWFSFLFFSISWIFSFIPFLNFIISAPCFILGVSIILFRVIRGWKRLTIQKPPQFLIEG